MTILNNTNNKIKYIIHLSDSHIPKNTIRHPEYYEYFDNLFKSIKEQNIAKENALIVLTGDILDNKLDISVEQVTLLKYFMINLTKLYPVILILGNHDLLMSITDNKYIDALTPLITDLNTENPIYFLKESGKYVYNNLDFYLITMFQKELTITDKKSKNIKIGLYHGGFKNDFFNNNYINTNNFTFTIPYFEKLYDIVLMGDIHNRKIYPSKILIQHAGSLLQLKSDETQNKGYILTDVINKTSKEINVKNNYGIVTIDVDKNGNYNLDLETLPKNIDLRIKGVVIKDEIIKEIKNKITFGSNKQIIKEKATYNIDKLNENALTLININDNIIDFKTINKQELINLINTRCNQLQKLSPEKQQNILNKITDIIDNINNKNDLFDNLKKLDILEFEFSNYGKYGSNNVINFNKLNNKIIGISAPNGIGKSSIVYAMIYALYGINFFNKTENNKKSNNCELINKDKKVISMKTKIKFKLNNDTYVITRTCYKTRKDYVGISVNDIIKYSEGSATKSEADNFIIELLGKSEELIRNSFDLKGVYANNFINMKPSDRLLRINEILNINILNEIDKVAQERNNKNLMLKSERVEIKNRFIKYNVNNTLSYVQIYDIMKDKCNEILLEKNKLQQELNKYSNIDNFDINPDDLLENINDNINEINKLRTDKKTIINNIKTYNDNINNLLNKNITKQINKNKTKIAQLEITLSTDVYSSEKYNETSSRLNYNKTLIDDYNNDINNNKHKIEELTTSLKIIDDDISETYNKYIKYKEIKKILKTLKKSLKKLKNHEYDENCKFCMKNTLTIQKKYLQQEISQNKKLLEEYSELDFTDIDNKYNENNDNIEYNNEINNEICEIKQSTDKLLNKINNIYSINKELELILKTKNNFDKNRVILSEINEIKNNNRQL